MRQRIKTSAQQAFCLLLWAGLSSWAQAIAEPNQRPQWQNFAAVDEVTVSQNQDKHFDLQQVLSRQDGWWGYAINALNADTLPCCWQGSPAGQLRPGCRLDQARHIYGRSSDRQMSTEPATLYILIKMEQGQVKDLLSLGGACPLDGNGARLHWIEGIEPALSMAWLEQQLASVQTKPRRSGPIVYQSLHALGQHPGSTAALETMVQAASESEYRHAAASVLVQQGDGEARQALWRLSHEESVRSHSVTYGLVWRGLLGLDPSLARPAVLGLLRQTQSAAFQAQLVSALADQDNYGGTEGSTAVESFSTLLDLTQASYPLAVRRLALGALAESPDPRGAAALERALARSR